jgi:flagellar biosynthesis protein FlhF
MLIKNYTASSMRAALAEIKKDLGASAVILDTRVENGLTKRAGGPGSHVIVTAASEQPKSETPAVVRPAVKEGPKTLRMRGELAEAPPEAPPEVLPEASLETPLEDIPPDREPLLHPDDEGPDILDRIVNIEQMLADLAGSREPLRPVQPLNSWFSDLQVRDWLNSEQRLKTDLTDAYAGYMLDRIPEPDPFLSRDHLPEAVCFIGPPGCGVATVMIKSLAFWWRTKKTASRVVEVVGEHAPNGGRLASWADLFDLERKRFRFDEINRLSRYMSGQSEGTVFVKCDLPATDEGGLRVAKRVIRAVGAKVVVLVLSSTVRRELNEQSLKRYQVFSPTHLCISHWDDLQPHADVRHLSARSRLPLAYYTSGSAPCGQIDPFTNAELRAGIASEICGDGRLPVVGARKSEES